MTSKSTIHSVNPFYAARCRIPHDRIQRQALEPLPVEKQVLIIYAGVNGFLDDLPVEQVRKFEAELYRFVENSQPGVLADIREKKAIDDALKAKMESASP